MKNPQGSMTTLNRIEAIVLLKRYAKSLATPIASRLKAKVGKYCAWELHPNGSQIEAISLDLSNYNLCFAFQPFNLVGNTIREMARDNAHDMLLVSPNWPGQYWFPVIHQFIQAGEKNLQFTNSKKLLTLPLKPIVCHQQTSPTTNHLWHRGL